jgi:hypothetical protein
MNSIKTCDHGGGPVEVGLFALGRPVGGWRGQDVAHIADLVGQLDQLGPGRDVRRMLDLQLRAHRLIEQLVVGHILHAALVGQHIGQRNRVVDVRRGLGVFAPLVAVLVGGKGHGLDQSGQGIGGRLHGLIHFKMGAN